MVYPIEEIRAKFPALKRSLDGKPFVYFDGPGGTQMVDDAIQSMVSYISNGMANLHGTFTTSIETDAMLDESRRAVSDLLGCNENEVAFGANMTTLAFSLARSLAPFINEGDEIVVTELDHRANVDPWLTLAKDRGATVKFIKLNKEGRVLQLDHLEDIITTKTKLVAVGMSSNVTGTVTDVTDIITKAKQVGAIVALDAVHAVPHLSIDFKQLNCDILLCSAYKFFGPHVGIAVVKEELFESLSIYKLKPAPTDIPYKLETGTQNHEGIAGLKGAIQFIESLGIGETRRERLRSAMVEIEKYETQLANDLELFLQGVPGLTLYRAGGSSMKTPTLAFTLENKNSREVTEWFAENHHIFIADGDFYASTMGDLYKISSSNGWVRIGLAPYNTKEEVELFKEALQEYLKVNVISKS